MSILHELPQTEGSVKVRGKISYTSQQPWVFSASLRQNIVFGNKFDSARYSKIIKACALDKVYLCCNILFLHSPVSLSIITIPIKFVMYGPIQFFNDYFNSTGKWYNCLKLYIKYK